MNYTDPEKPLIQSNYFRAALICGIIFAASAFGVSSLAKQESCHDYYIRYCDYRDYDIDICFRDDDIYCCHKDRYEHHGRRWRGECGKYNTCYKIINQYERKRCDNEYLEEVGSFMYVLALSCLGLLVFLYWKHNKAKDEANDR